jgi:hypothetical protein
VEINGIINQASLLCAFFALYISSRYAVYNSGFLEETRRNHISKCREGAFTTPGIDRSRKTVKLKKAFLSSDDIPINVIDLCTDEQCT